MEIIYEEDGKPGLCFLFKCVDKFFWGCKMSGQFAWTYIDNESGVGDGVLPLLSGNLSLCELR